MRNVPTNGGEGRGREERGFETFARNRKDIRAESRGESNYEFVGRVKLCPIMAMHSCTPSSSPRYRNRETRNFRRDVLSMNADKWTDEWMDSPGYG